MRMSLREIRNKIINDKSNAWATKKGWEPVYTAHKDAQIVIIGQAPGKKAQESHIPWNDPSGDNLRDWLGISQETFYDEKSIALLPMDFYFPGSGKGGDIAPRPDFAPTWHPLILCEMSQVKLILLIGSYAQKYYLRDRAEKTLTDTVKNYKEYLPKYLPLIHPSPRNNIWQKKNPWFKREVVPELKRLVKKSLEN